MGNFWENIEDINKFLDNLPRKIWVSGDGRAFRSMEDIDDYYLVNIINYLKRKKARFDLRNPRTINKFVREAEHRGLTNPDGSPGIRNLY